MPRGACRMEPAALGRQGNAPRAPLGRQRARQNAGGEGFEGQSTEEVSAPASSKNLKASIRPTNKQSGSLHVSHGAHYLHTRIIPQEGRPVLTKQEVKSWLMCLVSSYFNDPQADCCNPSGKGPKVSIPQSLPLEQEALGHK